MWFCGVGGASEVGKSCYLLSSGGKRLLFDCGVKFAKHGGYEPHTVPKGVDAIFVSHAHLDHLGSVPLAVRVNPGALVYATEPTLELGTILLPDMAAISAREKRPALWSMADYRQFLNAAMKNPVVSEEWFQPPDREAWKGWRFRFVGAGHILGAASILVESPEGTVLFSCDLSLYDSPTVRGARLFPKTFRVDWVVSESTYGGSEHPARSAVEKEFVHAVRTVLARGGKILIPAFGVGRSADVALLLEKHGIPVGLDGMAVKTFELYETMRPWCALDQKVRRGAIRFVDGASDRRELLRSSEPWCVVAPAGMVKGGFAVPYALRAARSRDNAIFIVGYQAEDTPGRQLLKMEKEEAVVLGGARTQIRAEVRYFNFSSHADGPQLARWVGSASPRKGVILVHGEEDSRNALRERLQKEQGISNVLLPQNGERVEL